MSIVGNRPLPLYEAEQLTSDAYIDRFMAPAGLTGLWQVENEVVLVSCQRKNGNNWISNMQGIFVLVGHEDYL